jgi:hypothetical protein
MSTAPAPTGSAGSTSAGPGSGFAGGFGAALLSLFLFAVLATASRFVTVQAFVRPAPLVLLPDQPG